MEIIEDSREKLLANEAEEKKEKKDTKLANEEVHMLKEEVAVLKRADE